MIRSEILKRIEKLEANKVLKNSRSLFIVCLCDEDIQQKINDVDNEKLKNTTYVVLKI